MPGDAEVPEPDRRARRGRVVLRSLTGYRRTWLRPDLLAGATLAAVLVPQGMAYAEIAGMPPITGLYATVVPLVAFALAGGSRHLVLGPDTSTSALVAAVLTPMAMPGSARYVELAALLALLAGALLLLGRVARLGFLSDLLAAPVVLGYQTGLGIEIVTGQLGKLLGLSIEADGFLAELRAVATQLGDVALQPALVGLATLATILWLRARAPRHPGVLYAVGGATLAVWALDIGAAVGLLGDLPSGLPSVGFPRLDPADVAALGAGAASVALISFTDTVVESRTFAALTDDDPDIDRDMVGIGVADVANSAFGAFPISASGSRTAVLTAAGGRTQVAHLTAAIAVVVAVVMLRPVLERFPTPAMAAVVISAGLSLIDLPALRRLGRLRPAELALAVVTLAGVLIIGLVEAIGIAVVLSVIDYVRRGARPADAVLGWVPGRGYHTVARNEGRAEQTPGVLVYRFEAPLFFANAEEFRDRVRHLVHGADPSLRWFVLDASSVTDVDTTAADALDRLIDELASRRISFAVADPIAPVKDLLARYGIVEHLAGGRFFETVEDAVAAADPGPR